jgi:hypothetical protein
VTSSRRRSLLGCGFTMGVQNKSVRMGGHFQLLSCYGDISLPMTIFHCRRKHMKNFGPETGFGSVFPVCRTVALTSFSKSL